MSGPFDKEDLGNKAILEFSSIRKRKLAETSKDEAEVETDATVKEKASTSREEMRVKLTTARMYAEKEIERYKSLVNNFSQGVEELTLFQNVGDAVESICIDYILSIIIEPTLKGEKPYGMPDDLFREMRREMYKSLIAKYVDNK
jgi:hypothetical protein